LIFGMDYFKSPTNGSMTNSMIFLLVLMALAVLISFMLKESDMLSADKDE